MAKEHFRTHKQKGQKQGIEVNPRVRIGKEEYQAWKYLRSKNLNISQKQITSYLSQVKKANAKLKRLEEDPQYLGVLPKLSTNVEYIKSMEDWEDAMARVSRVNSDDFAEQITKENRERLEENVHRIFGEDVSFKNLTPAQIKEFFSDFNELKSLLYYPEDEEAINQTLELVGKTKQAVKDAIKYIEHK